MKLDKYLWDKKINISILAVGYFIIVAMLVAFKAQNSLIIGITIFMMNLQLTPKNWTRNI